MTGSVISKAGKLFKRARAIHEIAANTKAETIITILEEANFPALVAHRIWRISGKLIISTHNNSKAYSPVYKMLIRWLYPVADLIITVSKELSQNVGSIIPEAKDRVLTIYNPIDINAINELKSVALDTELHKKLDSKFNFVSVGRLSEQKNYPVTLKVFAKLRQEFPHTQLVIIGGGSNKEVLKKMAADLGLAESVLLLGHCQNPFAILSRCQAFILNSLYEGFGIALVEAMSLGLPAIASNCDFGPREILNKDFGQPSIYGGIGDFGILVPVNNEDKLLAAMKQLVTDQGLRAELKNKGMRRAREFDINRIIQAWHKLV
ncbi:MAG: N-acetylgalactosamine-N,N'-diacetylbacillosaminyl-diphospho-undecaprenol 4-alpha-N-acetylgalactosaminyltransferase [bacterium ADurb.Bin400]|nr:MAG: N-acetylgalactosamine-N,N'-diacetylbacillosaminyl-diphospho-undecaprenol 4-alpha-N-acetylgalactosaminyltransferase [bacterium ADurb.Bin400]